MDLWFRELHKDLSGGIIAGITIKIRETLFLKRSKFQEVSIVETEGLGRALIIDGLVMLTERDEFIYHEMISHPAMFIHPEPRDILVVGGGDGGTVREVCRHSSPENIVLCEIDQTVIEASRQYLPSLSNDLFSDKRVKILIDDAISYVRSIAGGFDIILVDSSDPVGPAEGLFSPNFFSALKTAIRPHGIVALQCGTPFYHAEMVLTTYNNLKRCGFKEVHIYWAPIPTYPSGVWCWIWASLKYHPVNDILNNAPLFEKKGVSGLRYYNSSIHRASFCLPEYLHEAMRQ